MLKELRFTVAGKPMGKQRPRMMRTGHTYTPQQTVNYENWVRLCFTEAYPSHVPFEGRISMSINAEFPIPQSWTKKKKQLALDGKVRPGKPDVDNIVKIIADALNGVAYHDDAQVYCCYIEKYYGENPHVTVQMDLASEDEA